MLVRCCLLVVLVGMSAPSAIARGKAFPALDPASWEGDLYRFVQPTPDCRGGTVEQLGKRMEVSEPYLAEAFEKAYATTIPFKRELAPMDRIHSFSFRSEQAGTPYWGFDGYLVARGGCVIHAEITNYDN
ncbi:hypothetical protein ASE43_14060 [Lysobacter sp. Root983]|nr:hypothetical protein ASE43_14060 [Lysobacter sp. Root983]